MRAAQQISPGMKFGRLTIVRFHSKDIKGHTNLWECSCDCGERTIVRESTLKKGESTSCGCYSRELTSERFKIHGMSKHRLYTIFKGMKQRCNNPNHPRYADYGGRGIKICDEWLNDFNSFHDWAMSNGYTDEMSIDRCDNDKGYNPSNCRWVPLEKQSTNRRISRLITFQGQTKTISEWSRDLGGDSNLISKRLKRGWTIEEALTRPIKTKEEAI